MSDNTNTVIETNLTLYSEENTPSWWSRGYVLHSWVVVLLLLVIGLYSVVTIPATLSYVKVVNHTQRLEMIMVDAGIATYGTHGKFEVTWNKND